ncbi:glyoxalase [Catenulispora yoronensis]|uniref:Glyoxalase n=1 Tax=Catenulispora yoronensis TaxID=450799 RepID=A0ABP5EYR7_9ACTN
MTTEGIDTIFIETHSWGRTAKFFQSLGYELEFDTGHNSGQLRAAIGPSVFIAEVPADRGTPLQLVLKVDDADAFEPGPGVEVVSPFEDTHFGTRLMTVRDPDGRLWAVQAPGKGD